MPGQGSNRAQVIIVASADATVGTPGATPARVSGSKCGLLTRGQLMRLATPRSTHPRHDQHPAPEPQHHWGPQGCLETSPGPAD